MILWSQSRYEWVFIDLFSCIYVLPVLSSDITTLTSASYQSSLPMHAGQHLLSIQGESFTTWPSSGLSGKLSLSSWPDYFWWTHPSLCLSQETQSATVDPVRCWENVANSCSPQLWFQWVKDCFTQRTLIVKYKIANYCVHTTSLSSFRHVTIRRRGSARAQRNTDSSAEARVSMNPMVWLRPSIPPPTPLDHLYLSVLQAALKSEVKHMCLFKAVSRKLVDIMNVGCCGSKNFFLFYNHSCFSFPTGASAFQAMQYLPHQQPGYPVHSHFTSQPGQFLCCHCIPTALSAGDF